jgi:hypothetical protein
MNISIIITGRQVSGTNVVYFLEKHNIKTLFTAKHGSIIPGCMVFLHPSYFLGSLDESDQSSFHCTRILSLKGLIHLRALKRAVSIQTKMSTEFLDDSFQLTRLHSVGR